MRKSAKTAIRNNNANNVIENGGKVKLTKVPYGNWSITICGLPGYTFAMTRIYRKECEYGDIPADYGRLVLTAQNAAGETKIVRCLGETLYHADKLFDKLNKEGFNRKHRLYELSDSYVDSLEMDIRLGQCDYNFEEDILHTAFEGRSMMPVNFIVGERLVCRI